MTALNKHKLQLLGIAKTWACKTLPGWDDTAHRDLLARHGAMALPSTEGRVSATSMSLPQLEAALADYGAWLEPGAPAICSSEAAGCAATRA